jgi:fermentation-respiration switch protein FrsA (DUF1100 family)
LDGVWPIGLGTYRGEFDLPCFDLSASVIPTSKPHVLTLLRLIAIVAVAYVAIVALLYAMERTFLYPASTNRTTAAAAGLSGFQDVTLTTADGERLVAWWKPPEPGRSTILYFHGNGGSLWNRRHRARLLAEDGRGLLMVSYRGYSGSTGAPSETGLREDARAAYAWLAERVEPQRIVLYGESLGSGVAVRLASERPVGGLILDAPFTSTADVAKLTYWFVPVDLLMRDQFRSIDLIEKVKAPLLVMHGERDGLIPIRLGERLYEAARAPKRFVRLPDVGHASVLEGGGLAPVRAFLADLEDGLRSDP